MTAAVTVVITVTVVVTVAAALAVTVVMTVVIVSIGIARRAGHHNSDGLGTEPYVGLGPLLWLGLIVVGKHEASFVAGRRVPTVLVMPTVTAGSTLWPADCEDG